MTVVEQIKVILRERDAPFFTDDEIEFYLSESGGNRNKAICVMLKVKAKNTAMSMPGMSTSDTSKYFLRLAKDYEQNNTGYIGGV